MDEADILSDRIAVMKAGKLQTCGTSAFLKKRFGIGYNITFVAEREPKEAKLAIINFIKAHVDGDHEKITATVAGKEIMVRVPSGYEGNFSRMFQQFEEKGGLKERLQIGGYGISNSSLDEVFVKLSTDDTFGDAASSQELSPPRGASADLTTADSVGALDLTDLNVAVPGSMRTSVNAESDEPHLLDSGKPLSFARRALSAASSALLPPSRRNSSKVAADEDAERGIEIGALNDYEASFRRRIEAAAEQPLKQPSFKNQVVILLQKRIDVQKRDVKSAFYMLVLPALLVGFVLLILTLDAPLAGPPLPLSSNLYTYTNSRKFKKPARTLITAGGGAHGDPSIARASYETFAENSRQIDNDRIDWTFNTSVRNSGQMSNHLLESFNDHTHEKRFGAYVFNDSIPMQVTINWPVIAYSIERADWLAGNNDSLPIDGDLSPYLAIAGLRKDDEGYYSQTLSTLQLEQQLTNQGVNLTERYNATDLSTDAKAFLEAALNASTDSQSEALESFLLAEVDTLVDSFVSSDDQTVEDILKDVVNITGGDGNDRENNPGYVTVKFKGARTNAQERVVSVTNLIVYVGGGKGGHGSGAIDFDLGNASFVFPRDWRTQVVKLLPAEAYNESSVVNSTHSILHNASSPHAVPSFLNSLYQLIYNEECTMPSGESKPKFTVYSHPLPLTSRQVLEVKTVLSLFASLFILIPYCYIPAAFVVFVVKERSTKSKHLQLVSGVTIEAYWFSTFVFDVALYVLLTFIIMLCFFMYGRDSAAVFVGSSSTFWCTLVVTLLYGCSAIPFSYIVSRGFQNHTTAQITVIGIYFLTGFVFVNTFFILRRIESTKNAAEFLVHWFRLFPAFNVGEALVNLSSSFYWREIVGINTFPFDDDVCGNSIKHMVISMFSYALSHFLIEKTVYGGGGGKVGKTLRNAGRTITTFKLRLNGVRNVKGKLLLRDGLDDDNGGDGEAIGAEEDEDVAREREFVNSNFDELKKDSNSAIVLKDLWKVYPPPFGAAFCGQPKRAVRGLTTCVKKGEIFGLLGVNGAGKTTTLGILTGETTLTAGEAWITGFDVGEGGKGLSEARKRIGFCPQQDPLLELMTCRETLRMFAKLRGVSGGEVAYIIDKLMCALGLGSHSDKVAGALSGGNKRKLSLAVALVGDPNVLFIDEASSGMDPVARRNMWDLLSHLSSSRSIVLTTHSMEEAEALCGNIAIMVSGRMRCLGSPQHLKTRFVDGLNIDVSCSFDATLEDVRRAQAHMEASLPAMTLYEKHGRFLRYSLSFVDAGGRDKLGGLARCFSVLQEAKEDKQLSVRDYAINQYSLESVFIGLAKVGDGRVVGGGGEGLISEC